MRKVILAFVLSLVICEVFAQREAAISIREDALEWINLSDRIVEDKDNNVVYIGFSADKSELVLIPQIEAYPQDGGRKNKLNALLFADKPIFIQGYKQSGQQYINPAKGCGEMVNSADGRLLSLSHVKIAKNDLPLSITFNGKNILLVNFDPNNVQACETIRKYALGFTSPRPIRDTIQLKNLTSLNYEKIHINKSSYWKINIKYYINGKEIPTPGNRITIPPELLPLVSEDDTLVIKYRAQLHNDYFAHETEGTIAEIGIKSGLVNCGYSFKWWHLLILVVFFVIFYRKKLYKYIQEHKNNNIKKIQQDYIANILSSSEDRLWLISKLLSNVNDDFKQRALSLLNIELNPSDPLNNNQLITELKKKVVEKDIEINNYKNLTTEKENTITTLQKEKSELFNDNETLKKYNSELNSRVNELILDNGSLKSVIKEKDTQIEKDLREIKVFEEKLARINRQNMYLLQIDDVLKEVSDEILIAFKDVEDGDLKKKIVLPLLNGITGLDEGLTTYYKRWQEQVMNVQHDFFGRDLYEMTDEEVKTKLISSFLKNLAQGDTFSKLTRLYMYIQADWINEILIKNKFNVDKIEQIFNRLKLLFNDFSIEIIYPRLFVDRMNDQQYTFDPRCEVFKLFPISEDMRMSYSKQADLIIDIVQIGVKIPSENYSRKAIVSIPNF